MAPYVELHCHSHFSLRDGVDPPEALVARAAALGMAALALTDHDALYGAVPFARAAQEAGVRPIFGAELTLHDGSHLTLLVETSAGWANLCDLIRLARHHAPKGEARLPKGALAARTAGLIALSGCRRGAVAAALGQRRPQQALAAARALAAWFAPGSCFIEIQHHRLPGDDWLCAELSDLAAYLRLPTVWTNNVHYATPAGRPLHDLLTCARQRTTLDTAGTLLRANAEYFLKDGASLAPLRPAQAQALATTGRIAERCGFTLQFGIQDLPAFPVPAGTTPERYLAARCREGLRSRPVADRARAEAQLAEELAVITRAGLTNYLLIVWDIVRFCAAQGIRCQGRGSAANALVAYLLGIGPIDPLAHRLEFGRFLSDERPSLPDIDLDIQADRREAVIQYVLATYGAEHAAMACTYVTLRTRSARREVAQALGAAATPERVAALSERLRGTPRHLGIHNGGMVLTGPPLHTRLPSEPAALAGRTVVQWDKQALEDAGLIKIDLLGLRTLSMLAEAERLLAGGGGQHGQADGRPATDDQAGQDDRRPTTDGQAGQDDGRPTTDDQPGQDDRRPTTDDRPGQDDRRPTTADQIRAAESSSVVHRPSAHPTAGVGHSLLASLTPDDPAVYAMLSAGDSIGVFQVESRAQAQLLPRLRPACFADLIVAISLIRPGPIQGAMVHPYLRRRAGLEPVTFAHPLLAPALGETLGVILFQEQVLKVARALAGFSPGQGEQLRRALGRMQNAEGKRQNTGQAGDNRDAMSDPRASHEDAALARIHAAFIAGAAGRGVPAAVAEAVFGQLRAFAGYAFPKSHAAAFAVLVYQAAWLKRYHPAVFYTALLNHQPMGFWSPAVLVGDARRHGVAVHGVDALLSAERCTIEGGGVRLGLRQVRGWGAASCGQLLAARAARPFADLADLCRRTQLPKSLIAELIRVGGLDRWGLRRQLLWALGGLHYAEEELELVVPLDAVELPAPSRAERLGWAYAGLGLSADDHPLALVRGWLRRQGLRGARDLADLPAGTCARVAGLVVVQQAPPTAKGFVFLTLEDEDGLVDVILRPPLVARARACLAAGPLLVVAGVVQRDSGAPAIRAEGVRALVLPPKHYL